MGHKGNQLHSKHMSAIQNFHIISNDLAQFTASAPWKSRKEAAGSAAGQERSGLVELQGCQQTCIIASARLCMVTYSEGSSRVPKFITLRKNDYSNIVWYNLMVESAWLHISSTPIRFWPWTKWELQMGTKKSQMFLNNKVS